jgi:regulator of sigma E protease
VSSEVLVHIITHWIYPALLVLFFFGLTIFIHELGHFLVAKRRGMKVERFSIGFGPKIWGYVKDGIDYRVSWFPFGGYVALPQMSPMEAIEGKSEGPAEELPPASPASKIMVAFAGPIMNIVLAVLLACIVWQIGLSVPINPSVVGWVEPGSREEQLGIRPGDRIVQVNDREVKTWMDIQRAVAVSREPSVKVIIERDGHRTEYLLETELNQMFGLKTINLYSQGRPFARSFLPDSPAEHAGMMVGDKFLSVEGVPVSSAQELIKLVSKRTGMPTEIKVMRDGKDLTLVMIPHLDEKEKVGRIGVYLDDELEYHVVRPGPTPLQQFRDVFGLMGDTVYALVHSKQTGIGARSLSGPVGIAGGWWQEIIRGGVRRGLWFAVLLNINLAIINLLPFPILDGGHILFAVLEAVRRKPLNARLVHATSTAFAVLLISFMLYVTWFDLQRLLMGRLKLGGKSQPEEVVPATETNQP